MLPHYRQSKTKENYIKRKYEKAGFIVLKIADEYKFADLIAIDKTNKVIKFIQVKQSEISKPQKNRLKRQNGFINDDYICTFGVE